MLSYSRLLLSATLAAITASTLAAQPPPASLTSSSTDAKAFFEFQVEKPVASKTGNPHPRYPNDERARATGGVVTAQFVVDTLGHIDVASFEVVNASDKSFIAPVKDVLHEMRYYPAEIGGHKVRQLVEQNFRFAPAQ
jgi:outer membrane biosynthesis protein TonB